MAPAPTLQTQSRTEGHGPRPCRSWTPPAGGLVLCALFPGSTAPTGPERSELLRSRFDALLMQSTGVNRARSGWSGPGSRTGDP